MHTGGGASLSGDPPGAPAARPPPPQPRTPGAPAAGCCPGRSHPRSPDTCADLPHALDRSQNPQQQ